MLKRFLCSKSSRGVGLIETALFIMASGLMVSTGAPIYKTYTVHKKVDATNANVALTKAALDDYYNKNGRYPAPASFTIGVDQPGFGSEGGANSAPGRTGNILIGAMPVRALGLPDTAAVDGWGHLLTYAVTQPYTVTGQTNMQNGAIYVRDSKNDPLHPATSTDGSAVYVVAGANPDGTGAYDVHGKQPVPCPQTGLSSFNCKANVGSAAAPFLSTTLQASQGEKPVGNAIAFRADPVAPPVIPPAVVPPVVVAAATPPVYGSGGGTSKPPVYGSGGGASSPPVYGSGGGASSPPVVVASAAPTTPVAQPASTPSCSFTGSSGMSLKSQIGCQFASSGAGLVTALNSLATGNIGGVISGVVNYVGYGIGTVVSTVTAVVALTVNAIANFLHPAAAAANNAADPAKVPYSAATVNAAVAPALTTAAAAAAPVATAHPLLGFLSRFF